MIDDVAVLNFCRQSEERIMAEVRFCAHVLVVSWTYYLNIVLAHGFVHHTDFLVCQSACIAIDDIEQSAHVGIASMLLFISLVL